MGVGASPQFCRLIFCRRLVRTISSVSSVPGSEASMPLMNPSLVSEGGAPAPWCKKNNSGHPTLFLRVDLTATIATQGDQIGHSSIPPCDCAGRYGAPRDSSTRHHPAREPACKDPCTPRVLAVCEAVWVSVPTRDPGDLLQRFLLQCTWQQIVKPRHREQQDILTCPTRASGRRFRAPVRSHAIGSCAS